MSKDTEPGFATRWSQRKLSSREKPAEENRVVRQDANAAVRQDQLPARERDDDAVAQTGGDEQMLTRQDFDDVDFDALDKDSDYTRFIQANVPADVQKLALRKLWDSDPVFEVLDGMAEYDEDFTGDGLGGKALKTAYKVGRGLLGKDDGKNAPGNDGEIAASTERQERDQIGDRQPEQIADQAKDCDQTGGAVAETRLSGSEADSPQKVASGNRHKG